MPIPLAALAARAAVGSGVTNSLFATQSAFDLAGKIIGAIAENLPTFTHAITVQCQGGPDADLRRVWYLALATAFGRFRNRVRTVGGSATIQALWDVTGKACQVELVYTVNAVHAAASSGTARKTIQQGMNLLLPPGAGQIAGMLIGTGNRSISAAGVDPGLDPCAFLQRGPDQLTVGGSWPGFLVRGGTAINRSPGGGGVADIPSSAGGFGAFLLNAALAQSPRDWASYVQCGSNGRPAVPYARLTTYNRYGADIFREWPAGTSSGVTFYPFRVTATTTNVGTPAIHNTAGVNVTKQYSVPALPDDGRVITTGEKNDIRVQPPRPSVDGQSRLSLLGMTAQVLAFPCFLPDAPQCVRNIIGGTGVRVHNPGALPGLGGLTQNDAEATSTLIQQRRTNTPQPAAGSPNANTNIQN